MNGRPESDLRWLRRAQRLLLVGGVLAALALGLRTAQVQRASADHERMALVAVPVAELDGGVVIRPSRKGYRLRGADEGLALLRDGDRFEVAGTEFSFHGPDRGRPGAEEQWSVVLAAPLRVYAARETADGPRGGFHRIDIGGDAVGAETGTRDRIYVDHRAVEEALPEAAREPFRATRGVAHLVPVEGHVFRMEHRGFRVVAEIPDLQRRRGDEALALVPGEAMELAPGDRLVGPGTNLRFDLEDRWVTSPVRDRDGRVVAQRPVAEPTLVVRAPVGAHAVTRARAYVSGIGDDGEPFTLALDPARPTLLYSAADRLRPVDGRVVPPALAHEQLIEAFDGAVAAGAVRLDRGFLRIAAHDEPGAAYLAELDPALARGVRRAADRFNRGQVPGTVTLVGQLDGRPLDQAAGWTLVTDAEERPVIGLTPVPGGVTLPPPGELDPAVVEPGAAVTWELRRNLEADGETELQLELSSGLPVTALIDGEAVARVRGEPAELQRVLSSGVHELRLQVRYSGRPADYGQAAGARAALDGAELRDAHVGRRRYVDWTARADAGRVWQPAVEGAGGALWFPTGAPVGQDVTGYLQVRLDAPSAGPSTLTLYTAGTLQQAFLNGEPLPPGELPYLPGEQASLPVTLRRGSNLVALRILQPTALPDDARGGVQLRADAGTLVGLAPDTDRRVMDRPPSAETALTLREPGTAPRLVVARGVPGLEEGVEWWLEAPTSGGASLLLAPDDEAWRETVLTLDEGLTIRCEPKEGRPYTVVNRSGHGVELFRQIDPMRQPYQPFGGFAVRDGWAEPLREDRDAVRAGSTQATYRAGQPAAVQAAVTLVRDDGLHQLVVDGVAHVVAPAELDGTDHLLVRATDGGATIEAAPAGTLVYREGEVQHAVQAPDDLPLPLAEGDAVSLPHRGLLLTFRTGAVEVESGSALSESLGSVDATARGLRPRRSRGRVAAEVVALTLEPDVQLHAVDELAAQIALAERTLDDAGLTLSPGPEGLRGAVIALDVADGAVVAAAADGEQLGASGAWGLAWTHPGSTFKIVTALTALSSDDPTVQRMLEGDLPPGLLAAGDGTLRGAELPRLEPGDGRWSGDDDDPVRVRSSLRNFRRQPLPAGTDLEAAFRLSSNVYFGYLALLLHRPLREGWAEAGIADPVLRAELMPLDATARAVGFGEVLDLVPEGLAARSERSPPVVDRDGRPVAAGDALYGWTGRFPEGPLDDVAMAASGVGQGEVYATPLQMARVAAVVARDGELIRPRLVDTVDQRDTATAKPTPLHLDADAVVRTREGLRGVVSEGTAAMAFGDNPYRARIWGKTGSSERPGPDGGHVTDSWFVGVIEPPVIDLGSPDPAQHPVAVSCVVPGAGLGGTHAADVADRLMRTIARKRGWPTVDE